MKYRVPQWYRDGKLGIMIHWGPPSVPAYAPTGASIVDLLRTGGWERYFHDNPYAEWYLNSLRLRDTPVAEYHRKHFGMHASYERFARRFGETITPWDATRWAELFSEAGARYVVMVTKHHDGYLMWPSGHAPVHEAFSSQRDIVGEVATAVRSAGMKFGVYYSGLLDWTVQHEPIATIADAAFTETSPEYDAYVLAHYRELIARYAPDLLWNDIGLPAEFPLRRLFHEYRAAVPDGVLNDRWGRLGGLSRRILSTPGGRRLIARAAQKAIVSGKPVGRVGDVQTVEYAQTTELRSAPWELVRGLGRSFAYNAAEPDSDYMTGTELVHTLADVVSKNGNLLLNVAPRSDGSISDPQRNALTALAGWLRNHGEAIYGTRPWHRAEARTPDGVEVRFTAKGHCVYAIVLGRPRTLALSIPDLDVRRIARPNAKQGDHEFTVELLGSERPVDWHIEDRGVVIDIPGSFVPSDAIVVRLGWLPVREVEHTFYTDVI